MYMRPTVLAGGVPWLIKAPTQVIPFASMHIGSGPGVTGLSAMQVKPLLPRRTVRIWPLAPMATMVAPRDTDGGAAAMALRIRAASPPRAAWRPWLNAVPASMRAVAPANRKSFALRDIIPSSSVCLRSYAKRRRKAEVGTAHHAPARRGVSAFLPSRTRSIIQASNLECAGTVEAIVDSGQDRSRGGPDMNLFWAVVVGVTLT